MLKSPIETPQNIKIHRTLKNLSYHIFCTTPHKVQEEDRIKLKHTYSPNPLWITFKVDDLDADILLGGFILHGIKSVLYNREKGDLKCTKLE